MTLARFAKYHDPIALYNLFCETAYPSYPEYPAHMSSEFSDALKLLRLNRLPQTSLASLGHSRMVITENPRVWKPSIRIYLNNAPGPGGSIVYPKASPKHLAAIESVRNYLKAQGIVVEEIQERTE